MSFRTTVNPNRLALACVLALASAASAVTGCAADRPFRNGVPNEQLFLRKAFIVRSGAAEADGTPAEQDDGWIVKATVLSTSTPNPLAESVLFTGAENGGQWVRFKTTQDSLQMLSLRELSSDETIKDQRTRTPAVVDSWRAQHVDLKLAVTNDGEKTNRFEENTELDWRQRQWVQVDLARNDLTDLNLFGIQVSSRVQKCTMGGVTTVVPDSIVVDESHDYIEWKTSLTMPVNVMDAACMESFGESGANFVRLGRPNVTAILKYSMTRAKPKAELTYPRLEIPEKDPIKRKYGPILETSWARDFNSGDLAARQFAVRFDPNKEMVLYFAKGYPEERKGIFTQPNGIVDQTNALFERAGAKIRLSVKNYDQDIPEDADPLTKERGREEGDVRYNFIRWMSDLDIGAPFIGVTQFVTDPRTGEAISGSINIADFPLRSFVALRVDAFLETMMCRASTTKPDKSGKLKKVCATYTDDGEWGPPLVEEIGPDGKPLLDEKGAVVLKEMPAQCKTGDSVPLVPTRLNRSYGNSSLYAKMQDYLGEPVAKYGPLGPRSFVNAPDADFEQAFLKVVPYYIFADPATNEFVREVGDAGEFGDREQFEALEREVEFHKLTATLDKGQIPRDLQGAQSDGYVEKIASFFDQFQQGQLNHMDLLYKKEFFHKSTQKHDSAGDLISFTGVMERAGRRCVDGHWETREEWTNKLIASYHALTVWHEFGHLLGLDHNFMGSVDKQNFPHFKEPGCDPATDPLKNNCERVGMYSSSVMEYSSTPDRIFWGNESGAPGWAPYDRGAIAWLYANETAPTDAQREAALAEASRNPPKYVSGQLSATAPWKDPAGFSGGNETPFLYCNATHLRYTPLCRQQDFGVTPSEIIANEIEAYEWQYAWRNFRKHRKTWDIHNYANIPLKEIMELRRFIPPWASDWRDDTLRDDFGRFNIELPPGANSKEYYYQQLATKFDDELSQTNQMVAAFHRAVLQQSSGERPFATIYDKAQGDVTQQGIFLDKTFAMQGWVGLWPNNNYDPNQKGSWISSYGTSFDPEYNSVAEAAVAGMIGQETFEAYPLLQIGAVILFARDTHSPSFTGKNQLKDWVGGQVFTRRDEMWDFFRRKAVEAGKYPELGCATGPGQTTATPTIETCKYDPMVPRGDNSRNVHLSDASHEFHGPDDRDYAWMEMPDRRWFVFVDKGRNIATYKKVRDYNVGIVVPEVQDDSVFTSMLPVRYHMDAFLQYNFGNQK